MGSVIAAVTKGAAIIEKHSRLNKQEKSDFGIQSDISMGYADLKDLAFFSGNLQYILGKKEKRVGASEVKNRSLVRRGIYARKKSKRVKR
jgi:sialic acid synthase SpsE